MWSLMEYRVLVVPIIEGFVYNFVRASFTMFQHMIWVLTILAEFHQWWLLCLAFGIMSLLLAPVISDWMPFYYSSSIGDDSFILEIGVLPSSQSTNADLLGLLDQPADLGISSFITYWVWLSGLLNFVSVG